MAREMEMDGNLEELGVEEQKVELWVGIEMLKPDHVKKNPKLEIGWL
jgi:hypothetical protein